MHLQLMSKYNKIQTINGKYCESTQTKCFETFDAEIFRDFLSWLDI